MLVCPDCNWHSVLDPAWLGVESLKEECDNCMDGEQKEHKVKAFTAENLDELPRGPFLDMLKMRGLEKEELEGGIVQLVVRNGKLAEKLNKEWDLSQSLARRVAELEAEKEVLQARVKELEDEVEACAEAEAGESL